MTRIAKACASFVVIPSLYPPHRADTLEGLAAALGIDGARLATTIAAYNRAVRPGAHDPARLDGCATGGLTPPKSNWALPIDRPPYYGYPLRPGVTFTYLGVGVDAGGRVLRSSGGTFENVFAAGEVMAGSILRHGYLGGFGMTIGAVFGRLAGAAAASLAGYATSRAT